jgi:hypothetical protein
VISQTESSFRFDFGTTWQHVVAWDASDAFKSGIARVQGRVEPRDEGTKAADFVAIRGHEVWVFEIKDFRNRFEEFRARRGELPLELALKVRDTLAGVVGLHHDQAAPVWAHDVVARLATRTPITVVAVIAKPAEVRRVPSNKAKVWDSELANRSKRLLHWLTRRVSVIDPTVPRRTRRAARPRGARARPIVVIHAARREFAAR